jgi:3D-(3,5/4)-trihydroxycyclohexane-1,2-dione acylhydrolase (decyclizing)
MTTIRMTMAQAIVRFLSQQYVLHDGAEARFVAGMFGIFGHGNVTGLGQALEEVGEDLPYYRPQNEQAMVHAAAAFAKMNNRLQILACTSSVGPGATNMITGAATATVNRLPVLLFPGDTFASRLPHPVLQQLESPVSMDLSVNDAFRPVSRFFDRINRPEQILASLPEAIRVLLDSAETGAVTIALPQDVQTEAYDYPASFFEKRTHRVVRQPVAASEIERAVELIREARQPLIVSGGGAIYSNASTALRNLVEATGIPICETQAGKGVLPWNHEFNAGPVGPNGGLAANRLARDADVVIAVGTRLADFTTASHTAFQNPNVKFIGLNVSSFDAHKAGALALVGDAREGLRALEERLVGYPTSIEYRWRVKQWKAEWDAAVDNLLHVDDPAALTQANVIGMVNEASEPRDVVVCAAGGLPGDLLRLWRPVDPKGYHLEYGFSCMGYEIAGGLGVRMAAPDRDVFVMVGDGSYLMLHTEIVTSLQEGWKIIVVVVDNNGFQCIRGLQMASGSPSFGNELRYRDAQTGRLDGPFVPVDFAKNAESLGAIAIHADNEPEFRAALTKAKTADRTVVIHVPVQIDAQVPGFESWWDVPIAEVSNEPGVQKAHADYLRDRGRQKVFI